MRIAGERFDTVKNHVTWVVIRHADLLNINAELSKKLRCLCEVGKYIV